MPKVGVQILTCNVETKQEEWIDVIPTRNTSNIITDKDLLKKDYLKRKRTYYKEVWKITLSNDISALMQGNERGFHKYHIDHIIPISYGFKNDINPSIIGHIDNLRPLFWKDNFLKSFRIDAAARRRLDRVNSTPADILD